MIRNEMVARFFLRSTGWKVAVSPRLLLDDGQDDDDDDSDDGSAACVAVCVFVIIRSSNEKS